MNLEVSDANILMSRRRELWKVITYISIATTVAFIVVNIIKSIFIAEFVGTLPTISINSLVQTLILTIPLGIALLLIAISFSKCKNILDVVIGGTFLSLSSSLIVLNIWYGALIGYESSIAIDPDLITILNLAMAERLIISGLFLGMFLLIMNWIGRSITKCNVVRYGKDLPAQQLSNRGVIASIKCKEYKGDKVCAVPVLYLDMI